MTVSTTSNKIIYSGNAADTVFPFTFSVEEAANLVIFYTDADGVITDVTADSTILVNAAIPPNPTPVGGSVTYPTSGSPIALGTFLTIYRDLSEVQTTSLDNQGTLYPPVIEAALDYLTMLTQQIQELNGRAIVVAVSDPDPEPLPPVAQRASMLCGFDSDGNPIAVALTSAGQVLVSTAMIPVVEAATLALARTAMGLGNIAVENIGAALEDDGAGAVRFISTPATNAISVAVTSAFHMTEKHATAAITYTNPAASTLFDGFGFYVYALGGDVTFAINAGDAFRGMSNGVSLVIPSGTQVFISTDGVLTWYVRAIDAQGMNAPLNLQINAAVSGNALTVSIKDRNGNDPSATSPVLIPFRNSSLTSGAPAYRAVTTALSITAPNGASFGTTNALPFRVWVVAFDNAGTVVLGLVQLLDQSLSTRLNLFLLDESALTTGTAIGAGSTAVGVIYSNGAVTTKPMRILGCIDFATGQAAAGTWVTAPDKIQLLSLGMKKPGDVVQTKYSTTTTKTTITNASTVQTSLSVSITPSSTPNIVRVTATGGSSANGTGIVTFRLSRGTGPTYFGSRLNQSLVGPISLQGLDAPGTVVGFAYFVYGIQSAGTGAPIWLDDASATQTGTILAEEIMV